MTALALLFLASRSWPARRPAGAGRGRRRGACFAVSTYILNGLAASAEAIQLLRIASPWWWFLDRNLLVGSPTFLTLALPLLLTVVACVVGVVGFERRDLHLP